MPHLAALVAAYHLGKESIDDEIVGNDSLDFQPSVGSIKIYDHNSISDVTDGVEMAEPYEYKDVDPYDYVGKSVGTQIGTQKNKSISDKESD